MWFSPDTGPCPRLAVQDGRSDQPLFPRKMTGGALESGCPMLDDKAGMDMSFHASFGIVPTTGKVEGDAHQLSPETTIGDNGLRPPGR